MCQFLRTMFESVTPPAMLAYLVFVYGTVGRANDARHRWEDLKLAGSTESTTRKQALKQTRRDFHSWYRSLILISTSLELLLLLLGGGLVLGHRVYEPAVLLVPLVLVGTLHRFCFRTYALEAEQSFGDDIKHGVFRFFVPRGGLSADLPVVQGDTASRSHDKS